MRDKIFYVICFGFISGVLLRSFVLVDLYIAILVCVISFSIIFFYRIIGKNKFGILVGFFILFFVLGILRFNMKDKAEPLWLESSLGQKVTLSGIIIDEPSIKENNQKLIVEVFGSRRQEKIKILVSADLGGYYSYGDEINFTGKLQKPENFTTDQEKVFDYVNYLRKDGIFYVMNYAKVDVLSVGHGNKIKNALLSVKSKFLEKINFNIQSPESLLAGGLILGDKASFNKSLVESFVNTGTIHIVALSGYNVTIVAEWIMKIFSFLPQQLGIGVGIFAIILFILMTGGSSTAVRAGIMATLALIARATGRNYDVGRILIITLVLMILFNPLLLVFDVSFQLSFIATIAVIFLAPKIEKYFTWVTKKFQLRDIISVTCAAYIFVLPFILYKMGNLSIVALPANVLILPFIPFTMLLGFLTGIVGLFSNILVIPFSYISYLFLHYELSIISFFSNIPFASFTIPNFPLLLTIAIYTYFIYRLFGRDIKKFLCFD